MPALPSTAASRSTASRVTASSRPARSSCPGTPRRCAAARLSRAAALRVLVKCAIAELDDEAEDVGLEPRVLDAVIAADQRHDLAAVEGLADLRAGLLRQVGRRQPVGIAVEGKGGRDLQGLGDVIEPAGGDPDAAGLVFLDRPGGHPRLARPRSLAPSQPRAALAHA